MKTLSLLTAGLVLLLVGRVAEAGIANCNGCTFQVPASGGMMTLNGTPTTSIPISGMSWYTAVVNTNQGQSYQIYPQFGQPMIDMPVTNMVAGTTQAWITWTIHLRGAFTTYTTTTPLTPN